MSVTWHTVRRWFTAIDIATMRELGYPLDNYEFVSRNANVLLKRLADGTMPPPPFKPWRAKQVADFEEWINARCPYNDEVSQQSTDFINLSQTLTGFEDLGEDPDLAASYLNIIYDWAETTSGNYTPFDTCETKPEKNGNRQQVLQTLLQERSRIEKQAEGVQDRSQRKTFISREMTKLAQEKLLDDQRRDFVEVVKAIILLWYTGFVSEVTKNHWVDGLMWRAAGSHPPGYSTEGSYLLPGQGSGGERRSHWAEKPLNSGKYTGLGNTATHFKSKVRENDN